MEEMFPRKQNSTQFPLGVQWLIETQRKGLKKNSLRKYTQKEIP